MIFCMVAGLVLGHGLVGLLIAWCALGLFSYVIVQGAAKTFFLVLSSAVQ